MIALAVGTEADIVHTEVDIGTAARAANTVAVALAVGTEVGIAENYLQAVGTAQGSGDTVETMAVD